MTSEQQIQSEIQQFGTANYNGKVEIPSTIIDMFKIGIMSMTPQSHGFSALKIKALASRKINEILNGEVQDYLKVIFNAPLEKLYAGLDFDKAVSKHEKFEKFVIAYHTNIDEFQSKMKNKKAVLDSLTRGINNTGSGMRMVN